MEFEAQRDRSAKRELVIRLLEEKAGENEAKAVSLEDCATLGDAYAMLLLGKCCTLGRGIEQNAERAESLISESATKGNTEAQHLMRVITKYQGQSSIILKGLQKGYYPFIDKILFTIFFFRKLKQNMYNRTSFLDNKHCFLQETRPQLCDIFHKSKMTNYIKMFTPSFIFNRQQYWRQWSNGAKPSTEDKHNTHKARPAR